MFFIKVFMNIKIFSYLNRKFVRFLITEKLFNKTFASFIGLDEPYKLSDLRVFIKEELDKEKFLGSKVIETLIHEKSFAGAMDIDAYNHCMDTLNAPFKLSQAHYLERQFSYSDLCVGCARIGGAPVNAG